jgi:uncharacterized protein (DUF427 family)
LIARGRTEKDVVKIPGPDHLITIEPATERVMVRAGDRVVADTKAALVMREATLPPVYYIPMADVDQSAIARSDHATFCPYKGDASYYNVETGDGMIANAIWEYLEPYESVDKITGHVAFYRHLVEISVE